MSVVGVVVVLMLECALVVGGEVVVAARVLADRGRDLDHVAVAIVTAVLIRKRKAL